MARHVDAGYAEALAAADAHGLDRVEERAALELDGLREAGTFKHFNTLLSPQGPVVEMAGRGESPDHICRQVERHRHGDQA